MIDLVVKVERESERGSEFNFLTNIWRYKIDLKDLEDWKGYGFNP